MKYIINGYLQIPISVEVEAETADDAFNEVQLKLNYLNAIYNTKIKVHNLPNLIVHDIDVKWKHVISEDDELIHDLSHIY